MPSDKEPVPSPFAPSRVEEHASTASMDLLLLGLVVLGLGLSTTVLLHPFGVWGRAVPVVAMVGAAVGLGWWRGLVAGPVTVVVATVAMVIPRWLALLFDGWQETGTVLVLDAVLAGSLMGTLVSSGVFAFGALKMTSPEEEPLDSLLDD